MSQSVRLPRCQCVCIPVSQSIRLSSLSIALSLAHTHSPFSSSRYVHVFLCVSISAWVCLSMHLFICQPLPLQYIPVSVSLSDFLLLDPPIFSVMSDCLTVKQTVSFLVTYLIVCSPVVCYLPVFICLSNCLNSIFLALIK